MNKAVALIPAPMYMTDGHQVTSEHPTGKRKYLIIIVSIQTSAYIFLEISHLGSFHTFILQHICNLNNGIRFAFNATVLIV